MAAKRHERVGRRKRSVGNGALRTPLREQMDQYRCGGGDEREENGGRQEQHGSPLPREKELPQHAFRRRVGEDQGMLASFLTVARAYARGTPRAVPIVAAGERRVTGAVRRSRDR